MMLQCAPLSAQLQAIDVPEAGRPGKAAEAFSSKGGNRFASRKRQFNNPGIRFDFIETEKALDRASAVQHKSSLKERARGAGRNASVGLGSSGMIVMVHAAGTLDLFSTIDRTWPVTADPAERTVAVLPLNWAIRKRRTSF
jgi:hypothetical protein